jgi:hypothetical protein
MSRSIPIKPFQPLPPLVRMEQLPDTPSKVSRNSTSTSATKNGTNQDINDTESTTMTSDDWMMLSPTNHSVTLSVSNNALGLSRTSTSMDNDTDHSNHDLWTHPLMMMMEEEEDDDFEDDQHTTNVDIQQYYNPSTDAARHTGSASGTIKRVSLDASDGYGMDVGADTSDDCYHMVVGDEHHDEFVFMDGLDHDPLLTLTGAGHDNHIHADADGDDDDDQLVVPYNRISSTDITEPNSTLVTSNNPYGDDHDHDPWTEAAAEAAFQMTNDEQDMMVFEIDQSFLFKMNGHTVGTESTMASSYSSVSPDLLSVTAGDNHGNSNVPPFFTSQQFQERCKLLAESMRASQLSRQCLSLQENIKLRDNLAKVLKDIENSSAKVQRHCLSQQIPSQPESLSEPIDAATDTKIDTIDGGVNVDDDNRKNHCTVLSSSAAVKTTI